MTDLEDRHHAGRIGDLIEDPEVFLSNAVEILSLQLFASRRTRFIEIASFECRQDLE